MAKEIKFNIRLSIDGKEQIVTASTNLQALQKNISSVSSNASKLRDSLISFNQGFEVIKNISSVFNDLTEESRNFASAMNIANTMAGKSGDDFGKLKGQVSELAKTIPLAREGLANGLYQVISNGVPEDNWITYLQKSAIASVGGIADLGETVKVTSTLIKNYELSWDKAGYVQDKIQLTAKNGVTSFEQLAQALPRVTGNAATLGVSIDELMASFATLTGVSGNTNEVATQMAAIFTALVKPSSEASKMAQQMGIDFNAASIKAAGGFRNFLNNLDANVKSYAQKTGMLEQEIYGKLFGSAESLRALGPLTGQLAAKFNENVDAMKDSAGTMADAYDKVANSGSAKLQLLKNHFTGVADAIKTVVAPTLPVLNFVSLLGNNAIAVLALKKAMTSFAITQKAVNIVCLAWRSISIGLIAVTRTLTSVFTGATVGATTLKVAIRSLLISSGVGVAILALTKIIDMFSERSASMKGQVDDTADSMQNLGDTVDEVKDAYDNTLKTTYAELLSKYEKLKAGWKSLSDEHQRHQWIKDNKDAFEELRLKINDTTEAEKIFNEKTDVVVEAFKQRAIAAAYAARLTALYQKQISLLNDKQKLTKNIADDAKQNGRNAKEGDLIPETWRNERYGTVANDGKWRFTKIGAERYNGSNVSSNPQINSIENSLKAVQDDIDSTQKQLTEQLATANKYINGGSTHVGKQTSQGGHDKAKTLVEKLQAQLDAAQKEKDNALTIEAKVKADAKITEIQRQINEATKGNLTIEAEAEPTYITKGSLADKRQSRSNAQSKVNRIQGDYEAGIIDEETAKREIDEINALLSNIGLKPIEVHFDTHIEELQEQLRSAQRDFDDAITVEAKVKADAKVTEIQRQIDEATKGNLTIEAEEEPTYITKGSLADKRQSYSNAQSNASRIQSDYEAGIINKDKAIDEIEDINKELEKLGIKPIKIDVQTEDIDKAKEKMSGASDAIKSMGSSLSGLGDAIEIPELNVAGTLAQAIATMVDGYATATAQAGKMGPWAWIAFAATGLATLTAMISSVKQAGAFATGGVIGGTSTSGDKKFARVNSGEMILNKFQQARLFNMVNGTYQPPTFTERQMRPITMNNISNHVEPATTVVNVHLNANARKMLEIMSNTKKVTGKSGRIYNV